MAGSTDLSDLGVVATVDAIRRGEVTSEAAVEACLSRIRATDGHLRAWVTVDEKGAIEAARARDADRAAGRPLGPLHGLPVGIKDIVDVAGLPTTAGAAPFAHRLPTADATLVRRLRDAGAVILGKTVPTQFAFKDPAPTLNPWSAAHTPGGSSSGSAAAVAARQVPVAIGTQTVGSILRPSAFCGIVGLKGRHGEIPLDGVVPLAPSFDTAGPMARSVADVALVQGVMTGTGSAVAAVASPGPPRLGVSAALLDQAEPHLRAHLDALIGRLEADGASLVTIDLPAGFEAFRAAGWRILEAETAAVHRTWFAEHAAEYGPAIAGLVRAGLGLTAAEIAEARTTWAAYRSALEPILARCDALLSPTAPGPPPRREVGTGDPGLCGPWSYAGVPAISIPTGLDAAGLPLAIQLIGGGGRLSSLLEAASWCEARFGFDARPPDPPAVA